jgi:hypothetical protein
MLIRDAGNPHVFAFSRIERDERIEYVVALNNSWIDIQSASLATCQPPGAGFTEIFRSGGLSKAQTLVADSGGKVVVKLAPLQCAIFVAKAPLPVPATPPSIRFADPASGSSLVFNTRSAYGHVIVKRQELRADVVGGDGLNEVTFVMKRSSRPNQYELLGTSDSPPYRVFWRPPADLAPGEKLIFTATVDDLRGHKAAAQIDRVSVAPTPLSFGIRGATVPFLIVEPDSSIRTEAGRDLKLTVSASGTGPMEFTWIHDGKEVPGVGRPELELHPVTAHDAGLYIVRVHNREGTSLSRDIRITVGP